MEVQLLLIAAIVYVTSAQEELPKVTFRLPYVDGNTRELTFNKRDASECIYTERTKELICKKNLLYNNIVDMWTKIPDRIRYISVNCLRDSEDGKSSGLCICKSVGTNSLATEPFTYCHLTALSMGSFNRTNSVQAVDLSENQISSVGPRSFMGLYSVKYLSLAHNPIFNIPFGIFCDLTDLEYLDLSHIALDDVFPSHAFVCKTSGRLDKLEAINLRHTGLRDVPRDSMKYLSSLTSLDLSGNHLVQIYKLSFSGGISLKHLNLSHNALNYLFPYFCNYLPSMTSLHLRHNQFQYFQFEEIDNCTRLEFLDLSSNNIAYFTGNSSSLVSIKIFNMSDNSVGQLNFSLAMARQLQSVDASLNKISVIADTFLEVHPELTFFNISNNQLNHSEKFPQIFNGLASLTTLDLSNNRLTSIPVDSFSTLSNLTRLHLHHNNLRSLEGTAFSGLKSLTYLSLTHNQLTSLPKNIFNAMTSLKHVSLSFNALTSVEAGFWPPLQTLALDNNALNRVVTGDFSQLESLDISQNKLSKFVGSDENVYINFNNLRYLDLSHNAISDISPRLFHSSSNLQSLNLAHNQLNFNISFEFLSNAKNLTFLHLSYNNFEKIGNLFTNESLVKLKKLDLSNNRLKMVSNLSDGSSASQVQEIDLSNCGLTSIDGQVFSGLSELHFVDLTNNSLRTFPPLAAQDHTLFDFTDNPVVCACNMSWLLKSWVEVRNPVPVRISTQNFHVPFCKVYTEHELANPIDLTRRQFMCTETSGCDHRCSCYKTEDEGQIQTVICRNGLSAVPSTISPSALSIFLDGNLFLSNTSTSAFPKFANMSAKELYVNGSGLSTIESGAFHGFTELTILNLAYNRLKALPKDIFKNKRQLKELFINDNTISFIEFGVFENLPSLKELDISGNNLVVMSVDTIRELAGLHRAMYFFLARNDWSCNCTNTAFKDFIDRVKFKIRDRRWLYCAGTREEMLYMQKSDFTCLSTPEAKKSNPGLIITVLIVVMILILVFAALIYFRREILSLCYYQCGFRFPGRERLPEMHFDCYLSYDPMDQHCSDYIENTLSPKLRNNGYSVQSSSDVIPDVEVTKKVVEDSRCALFIVDKNFSANPFYVNIFQIALERRKREKRFNVILLVLGDIDLLALQPDIIKHLRKGDYVTARSRLWWHRLVYELPVPSGGRGSDTVSESDVIVFSALNEDANT